MELSFGNTQLDTNTCQLLIDFFEKQPQLFSVALFDSKVSLSQRNAVQFICGGKTSGEVCSNLKKIGLSHQLIQLLSSTWGPDGDCDNSVWMSIVRYDTGGFVT